MTPLQIAARFRDHRDTLRRVMAPRAYDHAVELWRAHLRKHTANVLDEALRVLRALKERGERGAAMPLIAAVADVCDEIDRRNRA